MDKDILAHLFRILPGHVYWKDKNGVYGGCNIKQAQSNGLKSPEEIIGKTDFDLFATKEEALVFWNNDQEIMRSGLPKIVEEPAIYHGKHCVMLSHKIPIKNDDGDIDGVLGMSVDITERKALEDALKASKERAEKAERIISELRRDIMGWGDSSDKTADENLTETVNFLKNIIAKLPGHVYWKDLKGMYLGCNELQAKALGLSSAKAIVKVKPYSKLSKKEADRLAAIDREVVLSGKTQILEEFGIREDGTKGVFLTHKVPLKDNQDNVIGLLGVSIDISDRKKAEEELIRAKEEAESADEMKFSFISNMEHDIRTPILGMLGVSKLLIPKETDPEKKELLSLMGKGAQELMDYCNVILNFSKIESGSQQLQERKVDIKKLVQRIIDLEKTTAKLKGLMLTFEYSDTSPTILICDEFRIYRILMDVIGNAVKFTDKGYVRVSVDLAKKIDNTNIVLKFVIEDTGVGIPEDKQNYIFEKFIKLTASNTGRYKGSTGLGLTFVKEFMEDIGGNIEIKSKLGQGTKFVLTIPFKLPLIDKLLA